MKPLLAQPFWIVLNIYLIIEGINYISYLVQHEKLSQFKNTVNKKTHKKKIKKYAKCLQNDIVNHVKDPSVQLDNMFGGRIRSYSQEGVLESLKQCIYFPFHKKIQNDDKNILKIVNRYEELNNIKFKNNKPDTIEKINWYKNELKTWYKPLPIICAFEAIVTYTHVTMINEGFQKFTCKNGLVIWYRDGELKKDVILFVHAGAGGLLCQSKFITKLPKNMAVIIPELPGISFGGRVFLPPTVRQMAKSICKFIIKKNINTVQMISHSFGGNVLSCIINNNLDYLTTNKVSITNTILVEPIIFIPMLPHIGNFMNADITISDMFNVITKNQGRFLSCILLFRDIYAQFYAQRCFLIMDSLVGETDYEKNNIINIVFSENDELSPINDCVHYLTSKQYNCSVKVFSEKCHGDFCFDEEMQTHVLGLIKQ